MCASGAVPRGESASRAGADATTNENSPVASRAGAEATTNENSPVASRRPKVLVLTGPTAVGKTATSIALAKALDGEIISADSVQVYRGLDVGTAKVTAAEMDGVPHHCIDILDVSEEFSAGMFHGMAEALIEEILGRGKTPIVVGGTGLYLRWLTQGRPNTPVATPESEAVVKRALRALFEREGAADDDDDDDRPNGDLDGDGDGDGDGDDTNDSDENGRRWDLAVGLVASLGDAETAERLRVQERMNWYRMHRVLDILMQCPGKTLKELDRQQEGAAYDFRCWFLVRDRVELYRRIDYRVELMMTEGMLTETYDQLQDYIGVEDDDQMTCASRSIGYRDILRFLWERAKPGGGGAESVTADDVLHLTSLTQASTRQYSHRQMKWFRGEPAFRWLLVDDGEDALRAVTRTILDQFDAPQPSSEPDPLKAHRMTKEEERGMRRYATEMRVLKEGSEALERCAEELARLVGRVRDDRSRNEK